MLVEVAGTFAWTQGAVSQGGWLAWLGALPLERRALLPDGTRVLGVHANLDATTRPAATQGPAFTPN